MLAPALFCDAATRVVTFAFLRSYVRGYAEKDSLWVPIVILSGILVLIWYVVTVIVITADRITLHQAQGVRKTSSLSAPLFR